MWTCCWPPSGVRSARSGRPPARDHHVRRCGSVAAPVEGPAQPNLAEAGRQKCPFDLEPMIVALGQRDCATPEHAACRLFVDEVAARDHLVELVVLLDQEELAALPGHV